MNRKEMANHLKWNSIMSFIVWILVSAGFALFIRSSFTWVKIGACCAYAWYSIGLLHNKWVEYFFMACNPDLYQEENENNEEVE